MASNKKIQISSSFDIDSESLHEKIVDHNTGKSKIVDKQEPHHSSKKVTITSNPVKYETKGAGETTVAQGEATEVNPATIGYDTSQL